MIIYGIINQSPNDISCHSIYTSKKKRDQQYEILEKEEQTDSNLYYKFSKELTDFKKEK